MPVPIFLAAAARAVGGAALKGAGSAAMRGVASRGASGAAIRGTASGVSGGMPIGQAIKVGVQNAGGGRAVATSALKNQALGSALGMGKQVIHGQYRGYEGSAALTGIAAKPEYLPYSFQATAWPSDVKGYGKGLGGSPFGPGPMAPPTFPHGSISMPNPQLGAGPRAGYSPGRGFKPPTPPKYPGAIVTTAT